MTSRQEAQLLVENYIRSRPMEGGDELVIVEGSTIESPSVFVFFTQGRRYLETGDSRFAKYGNVPLVVDRVNGSMTFIPFQSDVDEWVAEYDRSRE